MQEPHKYWVIETLSSGRLKVVPQWLRSTDGLEVYKSEEVANLALKQRINNLTNEGACPRCRLSYIISTDRSLIHLHLIIKAKSGELRKCNECQTHWFIQPNMPSFAYAGALSDFIIEWCTRLLKPSILQYLDLQSIGNIGTERDQLYAAEVTLSNGVQLNRALVKLQMTPPAEVNFSNTKNWYYLDQVSAIRKSPYAYPLEIAMAVTKRQRLEQTEYIYLSDNEGKTYMQAPSIGVFMPEALVGKEVRLSAAPKGGFSIFIGEPNNYSDIDPAYAVDPKKTILILGDLPE